MVLLEALHVQNRSYLYVDDLRFFKILFRWHIGWSYAGGLIAMIVLFIHDYGEQVMQLVEQEDETSEDRAGESVK